MAKKILIVDDHQLVLDGLISIIKELNGFEIIGSARDGKEGVRLCKTMEPDLILMDIDMPIMNGLEASRQIKSEMPDKKIIILTMHNEASLIKKVMDIGADGYLLKNADREEFSLALKSVSENKSYFSAEVTKALLNTTTKQSAFAASSDAVQLSSLTNRELDVLKLIAEGLSNKEIGDQLFISHRTVDTHRTHLMRKLEVHNIAGLIKFAIKNGLIN